MEEAPGRLVEPVGAAVADPAEDIVEVGTLNGSEPQLGAPRMKPTNVPDVEQNEMPPGFAPVAPLPLEAEEGDGLDEADRAAETAASGPGVAGAGLTWA